MEVRQDEGRGSKERKPAHGPRKIERQIKDTYHEGGHRATGRGGGQPRAQAEGGHWRREQRRDMRCWMRYRLE